MFPTPGIMDRNERQGEVAIGGLAHLIFGVNGWYRGDCKTFLQYSVRRIRKRRYTRLFLDLKKGRKK